MELTLELWFCVVCYLASLIIYQIFHWAHDSSISIILSQASYFHLQLQFSLDEAHLVLVPALNSIYNAVSLVNIHQINQSTGPPVVISVFLGRLFPLLFAPYPVNEFLMEIITLSIQDSCSHVSS